MLLIRAPFTVGATSLGKVNPNPFNLIPTDLQLCFRTDVETASQPSGYPAGSYAQPNLANPDWLRLELNPFIPAPAYIASEPTLNGYPSNGVDTAARGWFYKHPSLTEGVDDDQYLGRYGEAWQSVFTIQVVLALRAHHTGVAGSAGGQAILKNYDGNSDMWQFRLTTNASDHPSASPTTPYILIYIRRDTPSAAIYQSTTSGSHVPYGVVGPVPVGSPFVIHFAMDATKMIGGFNMLEAKTQINHQEGSSPMNDPFHVDQNITLMQNAEWNVAFGAFAAYRRFLTDAEMRSNAIQFARFYNFYDSLF